MKTFREIVSGIKHKYFLAKTKHKINRWIANAKAVIHHQPRSVYGAIAGVFILAGLLVSVNLASNSNAAPINTKDANAVVECAYGSFLNRKSDKDGKTYWTKQYSDSKYNPRRLGERMLASKEGKFVAYTTSFDSFIRRTYRYCLKRDASTKDVSTWTNAHLKGTSRQDIFNFIVQVGDKPIIIPKEERCKSYTKGGSVHPLCKPGSRGIHNDVVVATIPGTNIVVNKAWYNNVNAVVYKANQAGYNLRGYQDPRVPYPAGSYRSDAAQAWLKAHGYPVARGVSMHQWGLAIDVECNGIPLNRHSKCLSWMQKNAPAHGMYMLTSERWHWSNNAH